MTRPRNTDIPVSTADPRYRDLLLRGARERFILPCADEKQAIRFRQVLQQFRHRMRKQGGRDWEPLYGCIIRKDGANLIFEPRFAEFEDLLSGIPKPTAPQVSASDLLSELKAEQEAVTNPEETPYE